jgi:hypothetical protein
VANCRTTCVVVTPPAASTGSTSSAPTPIPNAQATPPVLVELQFGPPHLPVELCAAIAVAIILFCRGSLL